MQTMPNDNTLVFETSDIANFNLPHAPVLVHMYLVPWISPRSLASDSEAKDLAKFRAPTTNAVG